MSLSIHFPEHSHTNKYNGIAHQKKTNSLTNCMNPPATDLAMTLKCKYLCPLHPRTAAAAADSDTKVLSAAYVLGALIVLGDYGARRRSNLSDGCRTRQPIEIAAALVAAVVTIGLYGGGESWHSKL
jgi:hypothetical protein